MKRSVYDNTGQTLIREDEAEPICGKDFCESCGDCLVCFAEDGPHWWVQYGERDDDRP